MKPKKKGSKVLWWILVLILFYIFTTATKTTGTVEEKKTVDQQYVSQEPYIVEKLVETTKYRTENVPYGTPRCQQLNYNFSRTYSYSEQIVNGQKIATCTFMVKNEEDISGKFTLHPQLIKSGKINDGPDLMKTIGPLATEKFEWNFTLDPFENANCILQCSNCPVRMKCFYLEPITYQIKEVPYTISELKNVTEFRNIIKTRKETVVENVTKNIYTNRFFGYKQFFYFGY